MILRTNRLWFGLGLELRSPFNVVRVLLCIPFIHPYLDLGQMNLLPLTGDSLGIALASQSSYVGARYLLRRPCS